jgi:hypothetical protein
MIDSNSFERDAVGKPVSAFPHPALELDPKSCRLFGKEDAAKLKW